MGPSCLAGVAVISLAMPLVKFITAVMKRLQSQLLKVKDERMKVCYEVLSGIKVIKLQAWEESYINKVMDFRDHELNRLKKYVLARATFSTVSNTVSAIKTKSIKLIYSNLTLNIVTCSRWGGCICYLCYVRAFSGCQYCPD